MGKDSWQRPPQISREEENVRWLLYNGKITFEQYECKRKKLMKRGLWGQRKLRFKPKC